MEHLTTDEIIAFVTVASLNGETMALAAKVNGHIRTCQRCLEQVRSFQLMNEELERLESSGVFSAGSQHDVDR